MTKTNKNTIPSVLAFEKKMVPSDGYMYGTTWGEKENITPLKLNEKSVRGTISNRLKKEIANDPAKLNAEVEKANLQTVDSCSLATDQDTLKMEFTLKILSGVENPSTCNNETFNKSYKELAEKYIEEYGFAELAKRYATNIANARFLWRNRVGTEKIEVTVKTLNEGMEKEYLFDANTIGIRDFNSSNSDLKEVADEIAKTLSGEREFLLFNVTAFAKVGQSQEVYPSEELVLDKSKGKKGKILYSVNEQAAMHSQKIGNALRTIDTWYPVEDSDIGPIAIEPYGAVTNRGIAYRNPKEKKDFYTLFDGRFSGSGDWKDLDEDQRHYVMAVLVRGGVFGKGDRE